MVIIVLGLPGSGKSFFASRLADELKATYLNTDEVRMKMFTSRTYSDAEKMAVYDAMLVAMSDSIRNGMPVVLDGTFYKKALRNKFEEAAAQLDKKIIYIEVTAPENIIEERLKQPRKFSEADFEVYQKIKVTVEPLEEDHLVLDSTHPVSSMLTKANHYINTFK